MRPLKLRAVDEITVLPSAMAPLETITTSLDRRRHSGVTPNGLALDAQRQRLYVANADANCVAVVDVSRPGASRPIAQKL